MKQSKSLRQSGPKPVRDRVNAFESFEGAFCWLREEHLEVVQRSPSFLGQYKTARLVLFERGGGGRLSRPHPLFARVILVTKSVCMPRVWHVDHLYIPLPYGVQVRVRARTTAQHYYLTVRLAGRFQLRSIFVCTRQENATRDADGCTATS